MRPLSQDARNSLYCACAILLCFLLCAPWVDLPYGDEVSYTRTAWDLARTGKFVYNGWAAAMLGAQAYWGAVFIACFGFSFNVVRFSMIPVGIGSTWLLYALCRREGILPHRALFGTFAVFFMPVSIAFLPSFFTDMPGLFSLLATVYALSRVADRFGDWQPRAPFATRLPVILWLVLALVCGTLGGTVRQVIWLVLPSTVVTWFVRERLWRRIDLGVVLFLFAGIQAFTASRLTNWFMEQPLVIDERQGEAVQRLLAFPFQSLDVMESMVLQILGVSFEIVLTLILYLLPVFIATLPAMLRALQPGSRRQWLSAVIAVFLTVVAMATVSNHSQLVWPWFGANVTDSFLTASTVLHQDAAHLRILPPWFCAILTLCAFGFLALLAFVVSELSFRRFSRPKEVEAGEGDAVQSRVAGRTGNVLPSLIAFAGVYFAAMIVKSFFPLSPWILDRYVVLLMPTAMIGLLKWERGSPQVVTSPSPLVSVAWAAWAVGAYFGVGLTHDYFAYLRAALAQVDRLKASGVPDTAIFAGFEHDAWTQITVAGSINDRRVINKLTPYLPPRYFFPGKAVYHNWNMTPVIDPKYFVAIQRFDGFDEAAIPPEPVTCWLPPFTRTVYVLRVPPASPSSVVKRNDPP